jgi:hypothetical protein
MKNLLLFFVFTLNFTLVFGQYEIPKFGKIEKSELEMTRYDKDTSAMALMLFDDGLSEFKISRERTFQFVYNRHYKIKILKQSALDLANLEIRLYSNNSYKEKLSDLKAVTYNLVDGDIVKTKFNPKDILEAKGKSYIDNKCAFPEVKVGSVIEVSYQIVSDFLYDFRGWKFQYKFPALISQYKYIIPEYFDYRKSSKGYLQFDINKTTPGNASYTIESESIIDPLDGGKTSSSSTSFRVETKNTVLAMKDIPAFVSEPNIDCEENYIQSIEFELSSVQYENQPRKDYTSSWESVNQQMIESEEFGVLLNNSGFLKDTVISVCAGKSSDLEKATAIYRYVQDRMKWNDKYSLWAPDKLRKPFNDRIGNSSEINLLLTLMLKAAGLKANPVILSTRENGIANSFFPTITKYNTVISCVVVGGKKYLLDATSKLCPFGVLPPSDINGKGRLVNNESGDWIDLEPIKKYSVDKKYVLNITSEGNFKGCVTESFDGYAGIGKRNEINSEKSIADHIIDMQESTSGLTISDYHFSDIRDNDLPVNDSLVLELTDYVELAGDKIMFSPLLLESITSNRYTLEDRQYPVNYNFPYAENYQFEYKIPEGYTIEFIPESVTHKLPDNSVYINLSLQSSGDKITVKYNRNINKTVFLPGEYKSLKTLYDEMVKAHSEKIILKKA